jgi:hypothetical protein
MIIAYPQDMMQMEVSPGGFAKRILALAKDFMRQRWEKVLCA